jgi:hypothetical protein
MIRTVKYVRIKKNEKLLSHLKSIADKRFQLLLGVAPHTSCYG